MHRSPSSRPVGFTLVELLVGCALGLAVCTIAVTLFARQLQAQREQLVEARLHQDLSAAMDLIVRGLRRAGHRGRSDSGAPNPYAAIELDGTSVAYSHSRDAIEDDRLDPRERAGFRLADGVLQAEVGGRWQAMTDPAVLRIVRFDIALETQRAAAAASCDSVATRLFRVTVQGHPVNQPELQQQMAANVVVRNDLVDEAACTSPGSR